MSTKFLIVGLGNVGDEYENTRHNIGFDVLDALASAKSASFSPDRFASVARFRFKGREMVLIKPTTFMNLSGKAVQYWLQKEKIPLSNLMIIADDLALPVGAIRIRAKGGSGGHNGLSHIEEVLQTQSYPRLRFGIGNSFDKGTQVQYVLGRWNSEEKLLIEKLIPKAHEAVLSFAVSGIQQTMNVYNAL
ncbi:MAG: aminoacyl-tRNA hydrolase [Candidatus Competibacteraceae bacterium]|nr:aminoacyl-tRNA hydrolase [Candidatus Competibacteraceae bacterium]